MPNDQIPKLNLPSDLLAKTNALAAKLDETHADVQFFRSILKSGRIEETTLDRVIKFIGSSESLEAAQIAIDLPLGCIATESVVASARDVLRDEPYTIHCGRGALTDAFPRPCRNRHEALTIAANILKSRMWLNDMWLRIDGPNGQSWNTAEIRRLLIE